MTPGRRQQAQDLFYAAVDLETEPQLAPLAASCAGDPDLRKPVEGLLHACGLTNSCIEQRSVEAAGGILTGEEQPSAERAGPYKPIRIPAAEVALADCLAALGGREEAQALLTRSQGSLGTKHGARPTRPDPRSNPMPKPTEN